MLGYLVGSARGGVIDSLDLVGTGGVLFTSGGKGADAARPSRYSQPKSPMS